MGVGEVDFLFSRVGGGRGCGAFEVPEVDGGVGGDGGQAEGGGD